MTRRRPAPSVPALRRRLLLTGWLLAAVAVLGRSVQLQVLETPQWRAAAAAQHRASVDIVAPRGAILDREGVALAVSRERFRVGIDPAALVDRTAAQSLLQDALGISARTARRVTDPSTGVWHVVPGRFDPAVREALSDVRGVYLEREVERFYPHGELGRGILGNVQDGEGRGGIEQSFDALLRGYPGRQVLARDGNGRPIPGAAREVEAPRAGQDVRLTIDLELQAIAQEALTAAVAETGARGGDVIVADPVTGEILALVSMEDGSTGSLAAINTPYEPGSTFKPFTVAALLEHRRASLDDTLDAEGGRWIAPDGRPLTDIVPRDSISLSDALRVSSNVAVAKAALRLTHAEQFETLRDFGFGVETGIPLPGEVPGVLRHPEAWTPRSPVSLAIGYEASVTPLQMAMAYGALANGGLLMEPRLVLEAGSDATPAPRVLRRVVSAGVAEALGRVLVDVVEEGTGTAARLGTFRVAGKSGTSRVYVAGSGYTARRHFASFVGYFPADDPQLVIFVKLDSPGGSYGGATAAPVTRATMEAVLAARQAPIDRRALVDARRPAPTIQASADRSAPGVPVRFAALALDPPAAASADAIPAAPWALTGTVRVPEVRGLPARAAARRLHDAGLRVRWEGAGTAAELMPPVGTLLAPGDTVTLRSRPGASSLRTTPPIRSADRSGAAPTEPPPPGRPAAGERSGLGAGTAGGRAGTR